MYNTKALIKSDERLKLTFYQTLTHYGIVFLLMVVPVIIVFDLVKEYFTETKIGVRSASEMMDVAIPFFILAIVVFFVQRDRLRFREIAIEYTDEEFREAVNRTKKDLGWIIRNNNRQLLKAERLFNWSASWGELITIRKFKNKLLLNSICDPDVSPSITSFGWNRKNINTFLTHLTNVINQVSYEEIPVRIKKEWSFINSVGRVLMYLLCLFIISAGLVVIFLSPDIRAIPLGLIVIYFGGFYIFLDLKVLLQKRKRKTEPLLSYDDEKW
jgi:hypothetical protein